MGLNVSKGNMYAFVTHTWNTIKGRCSHDCGYCYMKRFGKLNPVRFDEKELRTNLGENNFIFVGSGCDMWADDIPDEWIWKTLKHCEKYNNLYLFQTKNPKRILEFGEATVMQLKPYICTTIETNRIYPEAMGKTPDPYSRSIEMGKISEVLTTFVTIEPIMDFDLNEMLEIIENCHPTQVNIGADTGGNLLPEPTREKILQLIDGLNEFTEIHNKSNLNRFLTKDDWERFTITQNKTL